MPTRVASLKQKSYPIRNAERFRSGAWFKDQIPEGRLLLVLCSPRTWQGFEEPCARNRAQTSIRISLLRLHRPVLLIGGIVIGMLSGRRGAPARGPGGLCVQWDVKMNKTCFLPGRGSQPTLGNRHINQSLQLNKMNTFMEASFFFFFLKPFKLK